MAWRPKNLNEAFLPFNTLYAIIGHGTFQCPIGQSRVLFSLVYSMIMTFLYFSTLGYTFVYSYELSWSKTEEKVYFVVTLTQIGGLALAHILSWYYRSTFICMMKRMSNVDETLRKLGANFNYDKVMYMGISLIIYWLVMLASLNSVDVMGLFDGRSSIAMTYVIITTVNHPVNTNALVGLNFAQTVRVLGMRFHELNELIATSSKSYFQLSYDVYSCNFSPTKSSDVNLTLKSSTRRISKTDENLKTLIQTIKHVHLELMDISRCVDVIYGMQIALETACFFVTFTGLVYNLFNFIIDPLAERQNLRIFVNTAWTVAIFINLMIINRTCENISTEAERTGHLVHCINVSSQDPELSNEIIQFSLQLMNNPLHFSPAGLFTLNNKFIQGFLASVVTHFVILLDMDRDSDKCQQ